ncbi:MAG: M28 family peptidase [Sphingopyxis sp.]
MKYLFALIALLSAAAIGPAVAQSDPMLAQPGRDLAALRAPELKGRWYDAPEYGLAMRYVEGRFKTLGLHGPCLDKGDPCRVAFQRGLDTRFDGFEASPYLQYVPAKNLDGTWVNTANVVGMLRGTDPKLKSEWIVVLASLDGRGADRIEGPDNAPGVAVMLATIERITKAKGTRRSILFVATTAERAPMQIGTEYYLRKPVVPLVDTAAMFNIHFESLPAALGGVTTVGARYSSLGDMVKASAEKAGVSFFPEREDAIDRLQRGEELGFGALGIPVARIVASKNGGASSPLPPESADRLASITADAILLTANSDARPAFGPENPFREAR